MSTAALRAVTQANKKHGYTYMLADTDALALMFARQDEACRLAIRALETDGAHHKQWYLERVLEALGVDLGKLHEMKSWEAGIAP